MHLIIKLKCMAKSKLRNEQYAPSLLQIAFSADECVESKTSMQTTENKYPRTLIKSTTGLIFYVFSSSSPIVGLLKTVSYNDHERIDAKTSVNHPLKCILTKIYGINLASNRQNR